MSIIYEALKKTQHNRETKKTVTRKQHLRPRLRPQFNLPDLDWPDVGLVALISVLMVVSMTVYTVHFARKFSHHNNMVAKAKTAQHVTPANTTAGVIASSPTVSMDAGSGENSDLVLNGVLLSDEEKLALINNKTFHVGDMVSGMRIVSIDFNSVKLANGTQLMTLRTSS